MASLVLVAMLFLFVFPTRTFLAQQRQVATRANAVEVLRAENEKLAREAKRLQTPSEIETLARAQFNLVMPGRAGVRRRASRRAAPTPTTTTDDLP